MKEQNRLLLMLLVGLLFIITSCGKEKNCIERVEPGCACTMQYDPVCGCNEKTYGNSCAAECAGIMDYTKGRCD